MEGAGGDLDDVSIQRPQVATSCAFAGSFANSSTRCASLPLGMGAIRGQASETILPCVEKGGLWKTIRQIQTISTLHFEGWMDPPKDVRTSMKSKLAEEFVNFWRILRHKWLQDRTRDFPRRALRGYLRQGRNGRTEKPGAAPGQLRRSSPHTAHDAWK